MSAEPFGTRLTASIERFGNLCVGIDPHSSLLAQWDLDDTADGAREFGFRVVDAAHGRVAAIKTQVAFFERFGSAGLGALERVLASARDAEILVIADAKRGDIGSTLEGYAQAWLTPGSPLEADAVTLSPYLGVGALGPAFETARAHGKGSFVLAATSNPEAAGLQGAIVRSGSLEGSTVAHAVAATVASANASEEDPVGSTGIVLGATRALDELGIDLDDLRGTPILAPGFGHQGTPHSRFQELFGVTAACTLAASSRAILAAGPREIVGAIERTVEELA